MPAHDLFLLVADLDLQEHQLVGVRMFAGRQHGGHAEVDFGEVVVGDFGFHGKSGVRVQGAGDKGQRLVRCCLLAWYVRRRRVSKGGGAVDGTGQLGYGREVEFFAGAGWEVRPTGRG